MPTTSEIEKEIRQRAERRRREIMEVIGDGILGHNKSGPDSKVSHSSGPNKGMGWSDMHQKSTSSKENQSPANGVSDLIYQAKPARSVYTSPLIKTNRPPLWKTPPPSADLREPHHCQLNGTYIVENKEEAQSNKTVCQKALYFDRLDLAPSAPGFSDSMKKSSRFLSPTSDQRLYPSLPRTDPNEVLKSPKDVKDYSNHNTANATRYAVQDIVASPRNFGHVELSPIISKDDIHIEKVESVLSLDASSLNDIEDTYDMDKFLQEALGSALQLNSTMTDDSRTNYSTEGSLHSIESYRKPLNIHSTATLRSSMRLMKPCLNIEDSKGSNLHLEAEKQLQLMGQASKALTLCRSSKMFSNSASLVDAERLLLISTLRHKAILDEVNGAVPPEENPKDFKGQLRVFEVSVPLREDSYKWSKTEQKDMWFLCVLRHGQQILASNAVSHESGAKFVTFPGSMELKNLPSSFVAYLDIYCLRTYKPQSSERKSKLLKAYQLLRRRRKSCLDSAGSEQLLHLRTPAFALSGCVSIDLSVVSDTQPTNLHLGKVPIMSPLRGNVWVKFETSLISSIQLSGFLTILDKAGTSHAWQRRWCQLKDLCLHVWNYPTDQDEKEPIDIIDLKSCSSDKIEPAPRHLCARPRTLMLEAKRISAPNDMNSTIMECNSDHTIVRYFLSCDTAQDLNQWAAVLNQVLSSIEAWNIKKENNNCV